MGHTIFILLVCASNLNILENISSENKHHYEQNPIIMSDNENN